MKYFTFLLLCKFVIYAKENCIYTVSIQKHASKATSGKNPQSRLTNLISLN